MKLENIKSTGLFILRVPTFPLSSLIKLNEIGVGNLAEFEKEIVNFFRSPFVNESLFVASPILHSILQKDFDSDVNKKDRSRMLASLYKYYIRSHYRSTPFGLFAGFCTGKIVKTKKSSIVLNNFNDYEKKIRIDSECMHKISETLIKNQYLRNKLLFNPNSSFYELGGKIRFAEYSPSRSGMKYLLSSVESSDYLIEIINISRRGATLATLKIFLMSEYDVEEDEAEVFLNELVDSQILVSELFHNTTGDDYLGRLLNIIKCTGNFELEHFHTVLSVFLSSINRNASIKESVSKLNVLEIESTKNVLQVDLKVTAQKCELSLDDVELIISQVKDLGFFKEHKVSEPLDIFKADFKKRYGNLEIPLCEALDPDLGIGFGFTATYSPLIDDIRFPKGEQSISKTFIEWDDLQTFILEKYLDSIENNRKVIILGEEEIAKFKHYSDNTEIAASSYLLGSIFQDSDLNLKFIFNSLQGPSSSKLIGRFCSHDIELTNEMRKILLQENDFYEDTILAEILYTSEPRAGNVLIRPCLRSYEIPIIGRSTLPHKQQIPLEDLMLSVRNDEIFLRSKKLNKRILPRESSAYHPSPNDLPIYVFLSYLPIQEGPTVVKFNWTGLLSEKTFLPRVEYKNIILSLARWRIFSNQANLLFNKTEGEISEVEKVELLKHEFDLPRFVCLKGKSDSSMLLDLDNDYSKKVLLDALYKSVFIVLEEDIDCYLNESIVEDVNGNSFKNEVIIPLTYDRTETFDNKLNGNEAYANDIFLPGSEYLYIKVYMGANFAEHFLVAKLLPIILQLLEACIIEHFFFIRFGDPDNHLRIRFINRKKPEELNKIFTILSQELILLIKSRMITNYSVAYYEQESDVYGSRFINIIEEVFSIDSLFALRSIAHLKQLNDLNDQVRLFVCLACIKDLLDVFDLDLSRRSLLFGSLAHGYFLEFNGDKELKVQLDIKFRYYKLFLFDIIGDKRVEHIDSYLLNLIGNGSRPNVVFMGSKPKVVERIKGSRPNVVFMQIMEYISFCMVCMRIFALRVSME